MQEPQQAKQLYQTNSKKHESLWNRQTKQFNWLSTIRLWIFLLGISGTIFVYYRVSPVSSLFLFIVTILVFLFFIKKHEKLDRERSRTMALLQINQEGIARLTGDWTDFADTGEGFLDEDHPYTHDVDIFGQGSLFQLVNTTTTYIGELRLVKWLSTPTLDKATLIQRQGAIKELTKHTRWRQDMQAEGRLAGKRPEDPSKLVEWANSMPLSERLTRLITYIRFLPVITVVLALGWWLAILPAGFVYIMVAVQFIVSLFSAWLLRKEFATASGYKEDLQAYSGLLALAEDRKFDDRYLRTLQERVASTNGAASGTESIGKLAGIVGYLDARLSSIYLIINTLFLWDLQCYMAIVHWKSGTSVQLQQWLDTIAELEVLASLGGLAFDNPDWTFPTFTERVQISGLQLGHPLIPQDVRVCNDIEMTRPGAVWLITGSNMSGKSTYLRTVGINLVLAYSGAPVCADEFICGFFNIHCSMRVTDNLENRISSFYAELLRIKQIILASKDQDNLLFLIDEIFRGTNSKDRHLGAKTVIEQLSNEGAIGLVSTHDLELAGFAHQSSYPLRNYHFTEYYQDEQLHFSYTLKKGISQTTNAVHLMKMVGINIDETEE